MVHEPNEPHERILYADEVFAIQGAIFEVNRVMGAGFLGAVYQECLALEFAARSASGLKLGLLVNFGRAPKARIRRRP